MDYFGKGIQIRVINGITEVSGSIIYNGIMKKKSFSVNKYGLMPAFKLAVEFRDNAYREFIKEFGYVRGMFNKAPNYIIKEYFESNSMALDTNDNRFFVYFHRNSKGEVVYVGSGSCKRFRSKRGRTKEHLEDWNNLTIEIVQNNLSKSEAIEKESELIDELKPKYNKKKPWVTKTISYDFISQFAYFDETSPTMLRCNKKVKNSRYNVGDVFGSCNNNKQYLRVQIEGESYAVHKVVYCLYHKIDLSSNHVVDHIDGDKRNNHPNNLRLVTHQQNATNRKDFNESTGVIFKSDGTIGVSWNYNTRQHCRSFSPWKYFPDLPPDEAKQKTYELALAYRKEKIEELKLLGQYLD